MRPIFYPPFYSQMYILWWLAIKTNESKSNYPSSGEKLIDLAMQSVDKFVVSFIGKRLTIYEYELWTLFDHYDLL